MDYLSITSAISSVLQGWQSDFQTLDDFNLSNMFNVTGFQLTGGDCGIDRDKVLWQWQQGFSIFGIIQNTNWMGDDAGASTPI